MTFFQLRAKHGNFTTQEATHKTQLELFANEAELELSEEELNAVAGGVANSPTCSNGTGARSQCHQNGTCGQGLRCESGVCCSAVSGTTSSTTAQNAKCPDGSRPIATCTFGYCGPAGMGSFTCTATKLCCASK